MCSSLGDFQRQTETKKKWTGEFLWQHSSPEQNPCRQPKRPLAGEQINKRTHPHNGTVYKWTDCAFLNTSLRGNSRRIVRIWRHYTINTPRTRAHSSFPSKATEHRECEWRQCGNSSWNKISYLAFQLPLVTYPHTFRAISFFLISVIDIHVKCLNLKCKAQWKGHPFKVQIQSQHFLCFKTSNGFPV